MSVAPIVRVTNTSKSYLTPAGRVEVLNDIDLTIRRGEKLSLIGPSGCGKSTLLALIAGLLTPDRGRIEIDGEIVSNLDDRARANIRARRIGIALQSDNLIPFLTARENVELAMSFGPQLPARSRRARALELLGDFGVDHRERHLPRQLSGGEAQRVSLAVAMANEPELLLADELAAQLDAATGQKVLEQILAAEFAVLYVTHDLAQADLTQLRYRISEHRVHPR